VTHSLHAPFTHVIQGDYRLLVVGSQIDILILVFYCGHNLCCKYSNGSFEFILDIYVSKAFQWHKELFNPISFDLSNRFLHIQKSFGTPSPKMGTLVGVWIHSLTFFYIHGSVNVTPRLHFRPSPFHGPCLGRKTKTRIMTFSCISTNFLANIC
jgi:hypothetical protein